ncbi:MAG TPA: hypothetical protein VF937_13545 [Chloroflexota bacterium]
MPLITLDPTGARPVDTHSIAPRISSLAGKRVGLLHNVKTNARELVLDIGELLKERYDVTLVGPILTAGQSGMLARPEQITQLAEQADLVITAVGD